MRSRACSWLLFPNTSAVPCSVTITECWNDVAGSVSRGTIVELDRKVGEAIDIYVNNRLVARGEVVLVEEKLGVTMTEIIKAERS